MRVIFISDTHFGDDKSTLFTKEGHGKNYDNFKNAAGDNIDYIVLLGDIFDFSIACYEDVYAIAREFFKKIKEDGIIGKNTRVICVAGNHDYDLWHTVEYQANIINPMSSGKLEQRRRFRKSVPGILDDRKNVPKDRALESFNLPYVKRGSGIKPYGGLFLDNIIDEKNQIPFYFAYPNLYLISGDETVIITHGQYFEDYWSLGGEWAPVIFGKEKLGVSTPLELEDVVDLNSTLSHLACSGTGQTGILAPMFHEIHMQAVAGKTDDISKYLNSFTAELVLKIKRKGICGCLYKLFIKAAAKILKNAIIKAIKEKKLKSLRDFKSTEFPEDTKIRMKNFIRSSLIEIEKINKLNEINIPLNIEKMIFAHTHRPIGWGIEKPPIITLEPENPLSLALYNTGGWLEKPNIGDNKDIYGGGIFIYDTKEGFSSKKIDVALGD